MTVLDLYCSGSQHNQGNRTWELIHQDVLYYHRQKCNCKNVKNVLGSFSPPSIIGGTPAHIGESPRLKRFLLSLNSISDPVRSHVLIQESPAFIGC